MVGEKCKKTMYRFFVSANNFIIYINLKMAESVRSIEDGNTRGGIARLKNRLRQKAPRTGIFIIERLLRKSFINFHY